MGLPSLLTHKNAALNDTKRPTRLQIAESSPTPDRAGASLWTLRLPQDHGPAAQCRLAREQQAGRADLAA